MNKQYPDLCDYYLSLIYAAKGDNHKASKYLISVIQKGFGFYDLITENKLFENIIKEEPLHKLISDKLNNEKFNIIKTILTRDKVVTSDEYELFVERMFLIFSDIERQKEYKKLYYLFTEYRPVPPHDKR
jgi:hypothetical protein